MKRFRRWLRGLARPLRYLVAFVAVVVLVLVAIAVSATTWEYTNSPLFCGTICHTMPPEYAAYEVSPHARVACVDCHLGQEGVLLALPRKAKEMRHVVNALTKSYEPPIYVRSLRPARDTCERCHNPDKFSSDAFVEIKRYAEDEENTETRDYLIVKTGGGLRREGLGNGIHWHIENEVWFFTDDPLKQTIPYVRTVDQGGQVVEYFDVEAGLPPDFGDQVADRWHRMDCMDCHTRVSHRFRSPSAAMDDALARRQIDASIPYVKKQGVRVLSQEYASTEEGIEAIEALEAWYQDNYPDYYATHQAEVRALVERMKEIFSVSVFPNMGVGWQTHPDNAGHSEFPGCFRCHDGKHTSPDGETVRLECNICHSIPSLVLAGESAPVLTIDKPGEPMSHLDSNWLARHQYQFDETCAGCHDVSNPGGDDNSSFCSNSACHATEWKYVGLDAPAIRQLVEPPKVPGSGEPRPVPHPIAPRTDCAICHDGDSVRPVPSDHGDYEQAICTQCHRPSLSDAGQSPAGAVPAVLHTLDGRRDQCLTCHGADGFKPYPEDHKGRATETCLSCHELSPLTSGDAGEVSPTDAEAEDTGADTSQPDQPDDVRPVPHTLEGRDDCLLCHDTGGVEPFPDDHVGRTVDMCQECHVPGAEGEEQE